MSSPTPPTPSRSLSIFLGTLAAFASFAVVIAIAEAGFGGAADDANHQERVQMKLDLNKEQDALLEKYGLKKDPDSVIAKVVDSIKGRKVSTTTQVVPGSPTALKGQAPAVTPEAAPKPEAAAPTPAPEASKPAEPAAPAPAPAAPAEPTPPAAAPAPAAPEPQQ